MPLSTAKNLSKKIYRRARAVASRLLREGQAAALEKKTWRELAGATPPDRSKPYLSCSYIERGIVFWPDYISACCVAHSNSTGGTARLADFRGGELPMADILATRKKIIETHQSGGAWKECEGCPHLSVAPWPNKPHQIEMITLAHYTHCNLKCSYCYTVTRPELTIKPKDVYNLFPTFKSMIEKKILSPHAVIRISGGEPTMLKEFEELIDLVSAYGPQVIVYTNAVLYSPALEKALTRRNVELVLGIDAGSPEVYRTVKGTDDLHKAWATTARYAAVDPPNVWAKMILRHDNWMDVDAFIQRCEEAGVQRVFCDIEASAFYYADAIADVSQAVARLKYGCETRGIQVQHGEAGAQNLSADLKGDWRSYYDQLASAEPLGRALLFTQTLSDQAGVDGWLYITAARALGAAGEGIVQAAEQAWNAKDPNPALSLPALDEAVVKAFHAAPTEALDRGGIDPFGSDFVGFGWGRTGSGGSGRRWRWIGRSGQASVMLALTPGRDRTLEVDFSSASTNAALAALTVSVNGVPLQCLSKGWGEGLYRTAYALPASLAPTGLVRLDLASRVAGETLVAVADIRIG